MKTQFNMRALFKTKNILCMLQYMLLFFVVLTIMGIGYKSHQIRCEEQHCLLEVLSRRENLVFLLTTCFGLLTLFVSVQTLQKRLDMDCIQSLTKLRELLTSERNRKVHFALSDEDDQKNLMDSVLDDESLNNYKINTPMIDVYNYLGTLELGANMLRKGLIDRKTFYNQFGYRMANIWRAETDEQKKVRQHVEQYPSNYRDLHWIVKKMTKWNML